MDDSIMQDWDALEKRWRRAWTRADRADKTLYTYLVDVDNYRNWCAKEGVAIISLDSADEYVGHRERESKYGGRNAARAIKALGKFLADTYEEPDPFARLKVPVPPTPTKVPAATEEALSALLSAAAGDERDKCIILTLASTGMRRGEVSAMKWEHVDLANSVLHIPKTKTKQPRVVYLPEDLTLALLRYKRSAQGEWCWPSRNTNNPITAEGIGQMVKRYEKAAGLQLGTHAWRRKYAGDWLAKGGTETGLMAAAGWSGTAMVAKYSKAVAQANSLEEAKRLMS